MSNKKTLVSIIVPVYNTEEYLNECLDSLINQTLSDIEIICINDASTDNSLEILQDYAKKDERIIIINNENNSGPSISRNKGFDIANGEYITFCDSDDKYQKRSCEKLYDFAKKYNHEVVVCDVRRFNHLNVQWGSILHSKSIKGEIYTNTTFLEHEELVYDTVLCNKFIKKDFMKQHNIKFVEDKLYEDILFSMQLFTSTDSIGIFPGVKYLWRVRGDEGKSITQSVDNTKNLKDRIFITKEIINLFKSQGYEKLLQPLYIKLVEIDILQFINEFDICSEEFKQIMMDEVYSFVEKLPEESFFTLSEYDKLKYKLFLNKNIEDLSIIVHQQRLTTKKQNETNIKAVSLSKKVKKLKKQNKKLKNQLNEINNSNSIKNKMKKIFK